MTSARGMVRIAAIVVAPLAVCAGVVSLGRLPAVAPVLVSATARAPPGEPTSGSVRATSALLTRLGLDPEALAAAGVTAAQVPPIIAVVRLAVESGQDGIAALDAQRGAARAERDLLEREIVAGTAGAGSVAAFPVAAGQAIDAETALETALGSLHAEACGGLPAEVRAALLAIRTNRRTWPSLPAAHLVVERSEPQWLALRDALAAARIAGAGGVQADDDATQVIAAAEADVAVQAAILAGDVIGAALEMAWAQGVQ